MGSREPESRFTALETAVPAAGYRLPVTSRAGLPGAIIGRLFRDLHVVDMALARTRRGHLHERRLLAHLFDGRAADIAHGRAQAADELVDHAADRAAIRHAPLDAFGHELVGVGGVREVAALGALAWEGGRGGKKC